jgi:raffinose/stachyose/melibiose transport system permease protein
MASRAVRRVRPGTLAFFLGPTFVMLGVFLFWPIFRSFQLSTVDWDGLQPVVDHVGLQNWREVIHDDVFWLSVRNSFFLVIMSVAIQIPAGMGLAILVDRGARRFKIFKFTYFFPMLMSSVALGMLFQNLYDVNFGLIDATLAKIPGLSSFQPDWLGSTATAIWSVELAVCWQFIPFYMLLFLAAINGIPTELKEAAAIDGATTGSYTRRIQIPLLKGAASTALLLIVVGSLKYFDLIWVMTGAGPEHSTSVMATYMYENAFKSYRVGYGATVASALFLIVFACAMTVMRLTRSSRETQ